MILGLLSIASERPAGALCKFFVILEIVGEMWLTVEITVWIIKNVLR